MSGGSLFAPLGGLLSRFSRGGGSSLWVRACPALHTSCRIASMPVHALPYARPHAESWTCLVGATYRGLPL